MAVMRAKFNVDTGEELSESGGRASVCSRTGLWEKEEERVFELRNKEDLTPNGRSPAEVTVSQPTRTANGTNG
ncbi:pleckstrin homology domain-containing family H member 3 isoform X1 [Lates japonicus]|uniref:Pleckstrin homology domain-containing family H member 3 isoform X1 n=1 Tax=Lates japonicus TaxID=270547 RepID=A0AAD3M497_LATJO|nr:pleckstrin homology domain-containing family H member 3 isoform X1 [Lates japonicus]